MLDRKSEPGEPVHTTGILVKEAWEEWAAPAELVRRIDGVRIYSPNHQSVDLRHEGYFFMATDTAGLMRHLADETGQAGVEMRFGERYRGASANSRTLKVEGSGVRCRFLVGADGARSGVAASFGLDRNRRLLKGMEWEFEPSGADGDALHCFLDPKHAPGYIGWVVPGVPPPRSDLPPIAMSGPTFAVSSPVSTHIRLFERRVLERRGGLIPVGGLLRNFYRDRVLLVGDAAGMVSPLTAGGIHKAYRFGKLAADAIADYLEAGGPHPGTVVRRAYPRLALKHLARWSYDRLPVARALETGILTRNLFRRLAGKVFFDRLNGKK